MSLITIGRYRNAQEAYLARGALTVEGIDAVITDEQLVGINADSVILATARQHDAELWTQDADFKGIEGVRYRKRKP